MAILEIYRWLAQLYRAKGLTLNKLKRLFGFKREKKTPKDQTNEEDKKSSDDNNEDQNSSKSGDEKNPRPNKKPKGHGRNGKENFSGADRVPHNLEHLKKGDTCPDCGIGKLYPVPPGTHIHFAGQPPLQATIHETEKLRCNACLAYFEAEIKNELKQKYAASCDVSIALQKYMLGLPFHRLGKWQMLLGVPLPPSTLWERCENLVNSIHPVYEKLLKIASQGDLIHGDDTRNKILSKKKKNVWTTGIVSSLDSRRISLFFTGQGHCGNNMDRLLSMREKQSKVIFMSDALASNRPKEHSVLAANCNVHARRNFWDYRKEYPEKVSYVLAQFSKIYKNESITIKRKFSQDERLRYHQRHSGPIMEKLRRWGLIKMALKKVEPNEELGKAIKYFLRHYDKLTLFLRVSGVPLDNNVSERLLKVAILNRKNAYL